MWGQYSSQSHTHEAVPNATHETSIENHVFHCQGRQDRQSASGDDPDPELLSMLRLAVLYLQVWLSKDVVLYCAHERGGIHS